MNGRVRIGPRAWLIVAGLILALALGVQPAQAAMPGAEETPNGQVVFGKDFVLPAGEALNGDLVIFGGSAMLEPNSEVRGAVVIVGGSLEAHGDIRDEAVVMGGRALIAGAVGEDLVVMGGTVQLTRTAHVRGDLVVMGGTLQREPGAVVEGRIVQNAAVGSAWHAPSSVRSNSPWGQWGWTIYHTLLRGLWTATEMLVLAALAALLALFAPQALERTGEAVQRYPLHAGAVGLLATVVAVVLIVVLTISILGIPLALVLAMVMGLAYLLGLLSLGWLLGHRLLATLGRTWPPVGEAALGTFLLMLLLVAVDMLACLGWVVHAAVILVGVGAALLTYLGTREPERTLEQLLGSTHGSSSDANPPDAPPAVPDAPAS